MKGLQRNRFKVKLFNGAMSFANLLASIPNKLVPPPFRLIQMGSGYWLSRALYVATSLRVAEALGDGRQDCAGLAEFLRVDEDSLYRLMRMLSANGVFVEKAPQVFENSKLSHCLREDHPQSVRAMVLMHNSPVMARPWFESLEEGVRSGRPPFAITHGDELFGYMDRHPDFDALFAEAMESVEALTGLDYLEDFNWSCFERIIDVGGSKGKKAIAILERHPELQALVFDRPQVIEDAAEYWQGKVDTGVLKRVRFSGGDMLQAIPSARSDRDLYLFVAVFHGMGDEEAVQVLDRLTTAMGNFSPTIVIADMVIPSCGADAATASFDMQMLVNTRGRERTLEEWQALLGRAGFAVAEVVDVRTFAKLLVITRANTEGHRDKG